MKKFGRPPKVANIAAQLTPSGQPSVLPLRLQPKQVKLLELIEDSPATWIGYGGSRGGAKSYALRAVMLVECLSQPGIRCVILRRTYDLVRENHIDPMLAEFPVLRQFYHIGDKELRFPNGSVLAFRYGETKGDIEGMIGKEYKYFGVDQAEAFTEKELLVCRSCTRWPNGKAKIICTFNPGNIGHAYLKRIFFDHKHKEGEHRDDYAFLQAYGWDNVQWSLPTLAEAGLTEKDYYQWDKDKRYKWFIEKSDYGRLLNSYPPAIRLGWLLGAMDQFAGQYFENWDASRHVTRIVPPVWAPLWLGIDWGFAHNSVCLWAAGLEQGKTGIYRELVINGLSPTALAQEIVSRTPTDERKRVKLVWLSHDAFAKRDERECIAEQMNRVFVQNGLPPAVAAGRDPISAATLIYDLLRAGTLLVDVSCHALIDVMPMVTRSETKPEMPVKFDGDDAFDALRHVLKGRLPGSDMPAEMQTANQAAQIDDPLARWIFLTKAKATASKQGAAFSDKIVPTWYYESGA